jgi:hypothetical protein
MSDNLKRRLWILRVVINRPRHREAIGEWIPAGERIEVGSRILEAGPLTGQPLATI